MQQSYGDFLGIVFYYLYDTYVWQYNVHEVLLSIINFRHLSGR